MTSPMLQTPVDPKVALIEQVVTLGLNQQDLTSILLDDRVGEQVSVLIHLNPFELQSDAAALFTTCTTM